jgi:hypothetical protein
VASQYQAINGPSTLIGSNCQLHPIVSWAPLRYASSLAFNTVILGLTIWKIPDYQYAKSPVGYLIFRDSLVYFFLTTITNVILLSLQCLGKDANYIKRSSLPFSTLITTAMGCRLYLNLKLFNKRSESQRMLPFMSGGQESTNSTELLAITPPRTYWSTTDTSQTCMSSALPVIHEAQRSLDAP